MKIESGKPANITVEKLQNKAIPPVPSCANAQISGKLPPVPEKPAKPADTKHYYDTNKTAILKDLETLGAKAMRERWGISPATWYCRNNKTGINFGLAVRWGLKPGGKPQTPVSVEKKNGRKTENHLPVTPFGLPAYPAYDSTWPERTQITWLQTYLELKKMENQRSAAKGTLLPEVELRWLTDNESTKLAEEENN